jgi:hypothetical protein
MANEAAQERPTPEQEMAKFTGEAIKDGEKISPEKPEDLNPVAGKNTTPEEDKAIADAAAAKAGEKPAAKVGDKAAAAAKAEKLTDEESEAAITALDEKLGREATAQEIADALKAALAEKTKAAAPAEKKKETVQDRINKAVRKQRESERREAAAVARAERAEAALASGGKVTQDSGKAPLTGDTKKASVDMTGAPDPKDFEYGTMDDGYIRALTLWAAKQAIADQAKNQKETQLTAAQQEAEEKFKEQKAAFEEAGSEKFPDFEETVMGDTYDKETNPSGWPLSATLGALLLESEVGPDIAYMLAGDKKLAKEVFGKTATQQAAWFGRQEAKISAGTGATETDDKAGKSEDTPASSARKVSKAPTPVQRASGQGSTGSVTGNTQDFAAFEAAAMGRSRP